ncbi:MAG: aminotransferase class V-fold PLP-dependent enzyme [Firmicutes bacterium]|nr:aminotransferase class V-fold PLP-dependent enzyme [Bacillota bacterium]
MYTLDIIRQYIVGVNDEMELSDGTRRPVINFDNAATTPALVPVLKEVEDKLLTYGSIGRGFSLKSNISTDIYEDTRYKVLDFVHADYSNYTCFYVNNTTDGLNKLA